jgi:hypothetical protein
MKNLKVGDKIYIPTSLYIDRGEDDIQGGIATVSRISVKGTGYNSRFVYLKELPQDTSYNYNYLLEHQEEWKEEYGDQVAHPDPDFG